MCSTRARAGRLAIAAVALAITASIATLAPAWAGTTGKLSGRVLDEKKQPLAGVNIRILGQRLGAISDDSGNYVIIGIPGGDVSVRADLLGHTPFVADRVNIRPDFTTTLDITLPTQAVQLNEVRVEATRPLLQKDATGTVRFLQGDQLQRMPTRGYKDAAAQQSGVVNFQRAIDREAQNTSTLIIRGGRPNETAYFVDGFSQQDPLTGNSTTSINNDAIQEVVVLNGGFNAEYGRIMSGVVNVITKEGGPKYSGSVEAVTDNLGGRGRDLLGAKIYDYNVYDGSLGGPLVPSKDWGSFYVSGERRWQGDRAPSALFNTPLPDNSLAGWTGQGKVSIPLAKSMSLKLGGIYSNDDWRQFLNSYRFDLDHTPRYQDHNRSLTAQFNHTLSARAFYSLGGSYFSTERKRGDGVYFDDVAAYGSHGQADLHQQDIPWFWPGFSAPGTPLGDSLAAYAAAAGTGHVWDDYLHRKSSYVGFKGDYTNQLDRHHQLKAGGEFDEHTLRFYEHYFPVNYAADKINIDRYGYDVDGNTEINSGPNGPRKPITVSAYGQDKYERGGLVVNGGLRYDYIATRSQALRDPNLPLGPNNSLDPGDLEPSKTYQRVSPRLGIGFPVTDRSVFHLNWGQFFQLPNLQDLYGSYQFLERVVSLGGYFVTFGNPNLRPERTTAYEVGFATQLNNVSRFDVTAYYKDVANLVSVSAIPSSPYGFSSFRNTDFATIKGIDLGYTLQRTNHLQANVAYSLSFAQGTGSVSISHTNFAWYGAQPPKQTAPLDFDQRHKLSFNLDLLLGKGEGPVWAGVPWFEGLDVNVLYNLASGTPYTPSVPFDEASLAATAPSAAGPLNSRYGPWTQTVDLKVQRGFGLAGLNLDAYVWVLNVMNTKNAIGVYTSTGSPVTTNFLNTAAGVDATAKLATEGIDASQAYGLALANPGIYTNPRMVRFGIRTGF